jgi:hypothetical protein
MTKTISKNLFIADVNAGMTKAELSAKYEIPQSVVSKWVKAEGLKLKREVKPKYELVDDFVTQVSESTGY